MWLPLSTTCIGPKLVSGQEVAPFLCPVGSSGSLLWGGKKKSFAWAVVSEALETQWPLFPPLNRQQFPGCGILVGASFCRVRAISLSRVWPAALSARGASSISFLWGSLPLEWAVGSERMIRIVTVLRVEQKWKRGPGWWGAAFCGGFFSLSVLQAALCSYSRSSKLVLHFCTQNPIPVRLVPLAVVCPKSFLLF